MSDERRPGGAGAVDSASSLPGASEEEGAAAGPTPGWPRWTHTSPRINGPAPRSIEPSEADGGRVAV